MSTVQHPPTATDSRALVSVIEHFEGNSDTAAMQRIAKLLRPGGTLILTTLVNEPYFAEFYLQRNVYGDDAMRRRLIDAALAYVEPMPAK